MTKKIASLAPVAAPLLELALTGTNNYPMMIVRRETGGEAILALLPFLKMRLATK